MLLLPILSWSASGMAGLSAAEELRSSAPPADEIRAKRAEAREKLMLPSLDGIRGLAYGAVGFEHPDKAEKQLAEKLGKLGVPTFPVENLKEGVGPVDAMVHEHFIKLGNYAVAELTVSQWVTLDRSPKVKVRAVTYRNRVFVPINNSEQAVGELTDQFLNDFQKVNKKQIGSGPKKGAR